MAQPTVATTHLDVLALRTQRLEAMLPTRHPVSTRVDSSHGYRQRWLLAIVTLQVVGQRNLTVFDHVVEGRRVGGITGT